MDTTAHEGRKRGPKRTPIQRDHDRKLATAMALDGTSHEDIAAVVGVSRQQITHDLGLIRRRWTEEAVRDLDAARQAELERLDALERLALASFGESKVGIDGGNPKFLDSAIRCSLQRSRLLGLEAGARATATYSATLTNININAVGNDELERRTRRFYQQFGTTPEQVVRALQTGENLELGPAIPAGTDD